MKYIYKDGDIKPVQEKEVAINITKDNKEIKINAKGTADEILSLVMYALCNIFIEFINKDDADVALDSVCQAIKNEVKDNIKKMS
ncbi:MAG: hypothetical protein K2M73_10630 [Lachnospiraceae bacterium]|nr:hypothetical protein [Lachnospiraceae bacterium]